MRPFTAAILLLLACTVHAQEIELAPAETKIPLGESKTFEFDPPDTKDRTVKLQIVSRYHANAYSGSDFGLKLTVNDNLIDPAKKQIVKDGQSTFANRLTNRALNSLVTATDPAPWFLGGTWRVMFAPDFTSGKLDFFEGDPYELLLDVTDLIQPGKKNKVEVSHLLPAFVADNLGTDCALVMNRLRIVSQEGASPMAGPTAAAPAAPAAPAAAPAPVASLPATATEGHLAPGGALVVSGSGRTWTVESAFAQNRLTAEPVEWAKIDGNKLTAESKTFKLEREISVEAHRVIVMDRIVNTTAEPLGLTVRHEASLKGAPEIFARIAGMEAQEALVQMCAPANPSVHLSSRGAGLGMLFADDVLRNQAKLFFDAKKELAGASDDMVFIPAGATRTLEWSLYPSGTGDYWNFVNLARRDLGADFTIDGPGHVFGGTDFILNMPEEKLKAGLNRHGFKYSFELGGWVDSKQDEKRIGFGSEVSSDYWADYRARLKNVIAKMKAARPDIKVLVYYDTLLDTSPDAAEKYADSLIHDASGRPLIETWGGLYQPTYRLVATLENSYGKAMLQTADYLIDELGADGLGWDELEAWNYGSVQMACNTPDGASCLLDGAAVKQQVGAIPLLGEAHRLAVIDRMNKRGKMIVGNTPPMTRKLTEAKLTRFVEMQLDRADMRHQGSLTAPLGFIGWDASWGNLLKYLRYGTLPLVPRVDYEYDLLPHLFPITPIDIRPGLFTGRERIVTLNSGSFGWPGERNLVAALRFNNTGKLSENGFETTVGEKGASTAVVLQADEAAVLVKLPATLAGEATVRGAKADAGSLEFTLTCSAPVVLTMDAAGPRTAMIDGKLVKADAPKDGKLTVELPASKGAVVMVQRGESD